ncbi:MAG: DinB family protein [Bacteroidota bacterium]
MKTKLNSFLKYYQSVRKRTLKLIEVIQPEHLDFSYKPGKFSIADQIRHIGAIERYLYAETIAGRKNKYRGCGDGLASGHSEIIEFLHMCHSESLEIFEGLDDHHLEQECFTPTGYAIKKGKWLELLAEHEIHHRAQIYLYLNLLEIYTPPIYGLRSEEVAKL